MLLLLPSVIVCFCLLDAVLVDSMFLCLLDAVLVVSMLLFVSVVVGSCVVPVVFVFHGDGSAFHSGDGSAFHEGWWGPSLGLPNVSWVCLFKVSCVQFVNCWAWVLSWPSSVWVSGLFWFDDVKWVG